MTVDLSKVHLGWIQTDGAPRQIKLLMPQGFKKRSFNDFECKVQSDDSSLWLLWLLLLSWTWIPVGFFLAFPSKSVLNQRSCDIEISPNCQTSSTSNIQNPQLDASIEAVFFRWSNLRSSDCRMAKASTFDTSSDSEEDQEVQDFRNIYESAVILAVKDRQRKSCNNRFRIDANRCCFLKT